ncbi:laminin subunit alpha [Brevipalpus obovatus]|uniref:laminin subunit alpha n=1 Tax=Brevipalpus obovatus TaxID=246614 RepID=UPI003D9EBCE9
MEPRISSSISSASPSPSSTSTFISFQLSSLCSLRFLCLLLLSSNLYTQVYGQILNPSEFNIGEVNRAQISATATCGEGEGIKDEGEMFCKFAGGSGDRDEPEHYINYNGQVCSFCRPNDPNLTHPAKYAIDGTSKWWQSPPLSRGLKYKDVNLTIDLEQEFHVAYVYITMGNSPRPGIWRLERSRDFGKTFTPWQYYATNLADCVKYFGEDSIKNLTRDDQVICETKESKLLPLESGEIITRLVEGRPSAANFLTSRELREFTKATNVRLSFMQPMLFNELQSASNDPTVSRRYYYSVRNINIGGRCVCNGHASVCEYAKDPKRVGSPVLVCECSHFTEGDQCERCIPGYVQKKWKPATVDNPNECEKCNCNNHSEECYYDAGVDERGESMDIQGKMSGGGVCINCKHNTEGINCQNCKFGFYRPFERNVGDIKACSKCKCSERSHSGGCNNGDGSCLCKANYTNAPLCDQCAYGYHNYPECPRCPCYRNGTIGEECVPQGGPTCQCKPQFAGPDCSQCAEGYFGFPDCKPCQCESMGSVSQVCDQKDGKCQCKSNYAGQRCERCAISFFGYPNCASCQCNPAGTIEQNTKNETGLMCSSDGQCKCKPGFTGRKCDQCEPGYFVMTGERLEEECRLLAIRNSSRPREAKCLVNFNCEPCRCDERGSQNKVCNQRGKCECKAKFGGMKCNECASGFYRFPDCEACGCDPAGSIGAGCDDGVCRCKPNFEGAKCDRCRPNFYNYPICESCTCNPAGVVANFPGCSQGIKNKLCECKSKVTGRYCDRCVDQYKSLLATNTEGCEPCGCNRNGTINSLDSCNDESGQCLCRESVSETDCSICKPGSFGLQAANYFGCRDCGCDVGASYDPAKCSIYGTCYCKQRISGSRCDEVTQAHYAPSLYQYKFELEDGYAKPYSLVRFGYDEDIFPGYSWRGYANFSKYQREVLIDILINARPQQLRGSFFKVVLAYHNPGPEAVTANLTFYRQSEFDPQIIPIKFAPTEGPKKYLIPFEKNPPFLTLLEDPWTVSLTVDGPLLVDYLVLIPQAFYEASILKDAARSACTMKTKPYEMCKHYGFPKLPATSIRSKRLGEIGFMEPKNVDEFRQIERYPVTGESGRQQLNMRKGKYILMIHYIYQPANDFDRQGSITQHYIRELAKLNVDVVTSSGSVSVPVELPECSYTFECGHVLIDAKSAPVEFDMDDGTAEVIYKLNKTMENASIGITDFIFVPKSDWNIDYVKPSLICIMRNFTCQNSSYSQASSLKLYFDEAGIINATSQPDYRLENAIDTSANGNGNGNGKINPEFHVSKTIEMKGQVNPFGFHHFIVHYYQPEHTSFEIEAFFTPRMGLPAENGFFPIKHCPNKAGCRSRLHFRRRSTLQGETSDFNLVLRPPDNKSVILDYLLVIRGDEYSSQSEEMLLQDRAGEFVELCTGDAFYIDKNSSEFCRKSVFSISTHHNNGARFCSCNFTGSIDFQCDKEGGQCPCKPNVIGRDCSACKTGYYGFPDCKKCNCPENAAFCDARTGECVCPPNVAGNRCDGCAPNTFGYDPIVGCEKCQCNAAGVRNDNFQCDLITGQCDCASSYGGLRCDRCVAGHFSFPSCHQCQCDRKGATREVCNSQNGACTCKKLVQPGACDTCSFGNYNLEANNPDGCTPCFCFGNAQSCASSQKWLYQLQVNDYSRWKAATLSLGSNGFLNKNSDEIKATTWNNSVVEIDLPTLPNTDPQKERISYYFKAPREFLGKQIYAYGGFIRYKVSQSSDNNDEIASFPSMPDLILQGMNMTFAYNHYSRPSSPSQPHNLDIELVEGNFKDIQDSLPVTRPRLMAILVNLEAIYLRASYFNTISKASLQSFSMDSASDIEVANGQIASRVEVCTCPPNYQGTSCEECASGYYRSPSGFMAGRGSVFGGPTLGLCIPCECNGHSRECDPNTGKCLNCMHNTLGDHCEKCSSGYFGNATQGTPEDCVICPCPVPSTSNNFAEACEERRVVTSRGPVVEFRCFCKPGYTGSHCEFCDAGFYGNPRMQGDYCKQCQCNSNINPKDPASCDPLTGRCLKCLYNSTGDACEECASGFFGDSIVRKDCKECKCDQLGTRYCNRTTGECICHPNVIGDDCSQCKPDHYGFPEGRGCRPCLCGEAANGTSCDLTTGQCNCMPGVAGRTCDHCEPGYWDYTIHGCKSCGCVKKFSRGAVCDQSTGLCSCLPGVIGSKCDQCPYRWAFVDQEGCIECGECQHALLDDTERMKNEIGNTTQQLENTSSATHARKRLESKKKELDEISTYFNKLDQSQTAPDLASLGLDQLNDRTSSASQNGSVHESHLKYFVFSIPQMRENATSLTDKFNSIKQEIRNLIININAAMPDSFQAASGYIVAESSKYLEAIKGINFINDYSKLSELKANFTRLMDMATNFYQSNKNQSEDVAIVKKNHDRVEKVANSAEQLQKATMTLIYEGEVKLNRTKSRQYRVHSDIAAMENYVQDGSDDLSTVKKLNVEARAAIEKEPEKLREMEGKVRDIEVKRKQLASFKDFESSEFRELLKNVTEHAAALKEREKNITKEFFPNSQSSGQGVINYEIIIDRVTRAQQVAEQLKAMEPNLQNISKIPEQSHQLKERMESDILKKVEFETQINENFTIPLKEHNETLEMLKKNLTDMSNMMQTVQLMDPSATSRNFKQLVEELKEKIASIYKSLAALAFSRNSTELQAMRNKTHALGRVLSKLSTENSQTKSYNKTIPELEKMTQLLEGASEKTRTLIDLKNRIENQKEKLRASISKARTLAGHIHGGLAVSPQTFIELPNPSDLERSGSYTKMSLHFNTKEQNGFLVYLGNPLSAGSQTPDSRSRSPRSVADQTDQYSNDATSQKFSSDHKDFLAVEINGGRIMLHIDLGDGTHNMITEQLVNDGQWYKLTVERIGPTMKLKTERWNEKTKKYDGAITTHGTVRGYRSVLDLSSKSSRIYIGGLPPNTKLQPQIQTTQFIGSISDVILGETPLGLWNFIDARYNERGIPAPLELEQNELLFNGRAHAMGILDPKEFLQTTVITLSFRTYAPDGLMILLGGEIDYFAIQIRNEKLECIIDLGSGFRELTATNDTVNDGKTHVVQVSREQQAVVLKLDGNLIAEMTLIGAQSDLEIGNKFYIGGYPNKHAYNHVTNVPFEGCIKDVALEARALKFESLTLTAGISYGCPSDTGIREARFPSSGFIKMPLKVPLVESPQIALKFRTNMSNALLFYASNENQTSFMAIYLINGQIGVRTMPGKTLETTGQRFNDGLWHNIISSRRDRRERLDVDDDYVFESAINTLDSNYEIDLPPLDLPAGAFYLGGVPDEMKDFLRESRLPTQFVGCLGDVVAHEKFQSLDQNIMKQAAQLVVCGYSDLPFISEELQPEIVQPSGGETGITQDEGPVDPICRLPISRQLTDRDYTPGDQFGQTPTSRREFTISASLKGSMYQSSKISLSFKAHNQQGTILFISDGTIIDLLAIYMLEGSITVTWNSGSGYGNISYIDRRFDDAEWHQLEFALKGKSGQLKIDKLDAVNGESQGPASNLNVVSPIYVGGVSEEVNKKLIKMPFAPFTSFGGCIWNLSINDIPLELTASVAHQIDRCRAKIEPGSFFDTKGYLICGERVSIGARWKINLRIKSRRREGVLLSVFSGNATNLQDFLMLIMNQDQLVAMVNNGAGTYNQTYVIGGDNYFCDGNWHTLVMTKAQNTIGLEVDGKSGFSTGSGSSFQADTTSPLYFGGLPDEYLQGFGEQLGMPLANYAGCMKDISWGRWEKTKWISRPLEISTKCKPQGSASYDACPLL